MGALDDAIAMLAGMPADKALQAIQVAQEANKHRIWVPNPGPQTDAFFSDADELLFGGEAGGGKRISDNEVVPVPLFVNGDGFKRHGDLEINDFVYSPSGHLVQVLAVTPVEIDTEAYEIEFDTGEVIVADGDHLWHTWTEAERDQLLKSSDVFREHRRESRPSRAAAVSRKPGVSANITERNRQRIYEIRIPVGGVRTTREIALTIKTQRGGLNHSIAVSFPIVNRDADLPIDPYMFGLWIGDGMSKDARIGMLEIDWQSMNVPTPDRSVVRTKDRAQPFEERSYYWMRRPLKNLGVFGNKRIPSLYLRSSVSQRLSLLQGIMDTDGHADKRGQCECGFSNEFLANDLHELVSSLGIKATIRRKKTHSQNGPAKDHFRIKFVSELPVFRLARKLERQKCADLRGTTKRRYIVAARRVPSVPMRCIKVGSTDGLYLVGRSFIATHNSDLGIGLSLTEHRRSLVLRRTNKEAEKLFDRYEEIYGGDRDGFNSQKGIVRDGRIIDIGGCQLESDKQKRKGVPHDFKFFDELVDFTESQYLFITIWVRSATPGQRTRIVSTTNPPTRPEGMWVVKRWAPWLDPKHPNPAKDGELRWFTTINKVDTEVDGPGPHTVNGKEVYAKSRTFIRSKLSDNPDLTRTGDYQNTLNALPEELRQAYAEGRFDAGLKDAPFQAIPTAWIRAAMERWTDKPRLGVPMCGMGVDCTGGGDDPMVISTRHDGWFAPLVIIDGKDIPADRVGKVSAGHVVSWRRNKAIVVVDMGGGYGGALFEALKDNEIAAVPHKGAEGTSQRTKDGQFGFANKRSQVIWRFREALDPDQIGGSPIDLPPDSILMADLAAPTFGLGKKDGLAVIEIEQKVKVCARIGRSTDRGDGVVMAWSAGPTYITDGDDWRMKLEREQGHMFGGRPEVVMGKGGIRLTSRGRR